MEEFGNTVRRVVKVLKSCACPWEFNKFHERSSERGSYSCDLSALESIGCVRPLFARIYRTSGYVSVSHKSRDKFTAPLSPTCEHINSHNAFLAGWGGARPSVGLNNVVVFHERNRRCAIHAFRSRETIDRPSIGEVNGLKRIT